MYTTLCETAALQTGNGCLRLRKIDEVLAEQGATILVIVGQTKVSVSAVLALNKCYSVF